MLLCHLLIIMKKETEELKLFILECLSEKKAEDIEVIDLTGKHKLADYIIFASGRSTKNVRAIAEYVALELKNNAGINSNIEGLGKSEWVLIDAGTILINIFYPEVREHFKLEEIWKR
ncbi:Iojap-related protein [Rickettsia massiliae MTU5]|uniref:Ribosomal silencing factor RsfS n=4 Tax=spotted fever group TaxID=114277 RepID=A8F2V0_RICM5|nr:Iojap-related protein [Rickettsia massiliae MTU5]